MKWDIYLHHIFQDRLDVHSSRCTWYTHMQVCRLESLRLQCMIWYDMICTYITKFHQICDIHSYTCSRTILNPIHIAYKLSLHSCMIHRPRNFVNVGYPSFCLIYITTSERKYIFDFYHWGDSRGRHPLVSSGRVRHPLDSKKLFVQIWNMYIINGNSDLKMTYIHTYM